YQAIMKQLLISLTILAFGLSAFADPAKDFEAGNSYYQKKEYDSAIQSYQAALASGFTAPELEFNLGNALYKSGRNAEAILHYERASRMAPNDEEIVYNLRIASLKNTDRIEVLPEIFYKRWLRRATSFMNEQQWGTLTLVLFWSLCITIVVYLLSVGRTKRLTFFVSLGLLTNTGLSYWLGSERKSIEFGSNRGVVMSNSVYVKSSPDDKGNDLFILHDGTTVEVTDELGDWKKIKIANGTSGWLPSGSIEII
ncbi:MAG: tetratricopeptide repeat protein, partial [Bacteroidota bacterium]